MDLAPIYRCAVGLDVHQAQITVCVLSQGADGEVVAEVREFGGFKRDRRAMAAWVAGFQPDVVVMESTGIYWKSPYAALEQAGIRALVVNARHVKRVPGRKTDIADAQWLAILARAGLLTGGFVPPANFRELRLIARQLQRLTGIRAGEKNRLHKVLTDGGIRLSVVVSDLHCLFHANWTPIPAQAGHPFHANLDSRSEATRGVDAVYAGVGSSVNLGWIFRRDSPARVRGWAWWTRRSRMASARVGSPRASCQWATGNWLVTRVERV